MCAARRCAAAGGLLRSAGGTGSVRLLASSRQTVVTVSSAVAITSAATISELAVQGTAQYIALTAALAILAGAFSLLTGTSPPCLAVT